ncbi:MAG: pilus assembly protein [Bdellovibrionales bacterium]|nr:pilus assembly protein [Bdellovibrionales bacterium]
MQLRLRKARLGQAGTAMIEFAVTIPTFFGIMFGLMDAAFVLRQQIAVSQSVRETARALSVLRRDQFPDCTDSSFSNAVSQALVGAMQANSVYNAANSADIQISAVNISDMDSDIVRSVRYDMNFVRIQVDKQVPCVWCEFFGSAGLTVHASSTLRMEDPWVCNDNPFNFYGFSS